ncbi:MAG: Lrp/AsnC ligand binding domain-containing protein [Nitrososphaeria archaeon]|nr:Lrp/AsnC ligand binding domain-containing protein [Nitrososphaeria archaeon]
MVRAIVLINVEIGYEGEVLNSIRKVEGVIEALAVYGNYDIVAKVEAGSIEKLNQIITGKIRKIENVKSTQTMIVVDERSLGLEWIRT